MGSLRDRDVAYTASDRQGSHFESCIWRAVSSHSSHHSHEVLLAQFSLYVQKGDLTPPPPFISCHLAQYNPANTTHRSNLDQRRRRWANIGPTLDRCVVFAGKKLNHAGLMLPHRLRRWPSIKPAFNLFTTIHDGNFRRHSSMNVTIK